VTFGEVRAGLEELRGAAGGRLLSNYFFGSETALAGLQRGAGAIAWWHDEHDFSRLLFAAADATALGRLLLALPRRPYVCDFIARESSAERNAAREACHAAGFGLRATFARHVCTAYRAPAPQGGARTGTPGDADAIYGGIFSDFDRYVDHVPTQPALRQYAADGRLVVVGAPARIEAYATYSIEGARFHFDRLCNRQGSPAALLGALAGLYANIAGRGLKSGYLWANRANLPLTELHKRCGYRADGMIDDIYVSLPA
jgi:hypothetical protein